MGLINGPPLSSRYWAVALLAAYAISFLAGMARPLMIWISSPRSIPNILSYGFDVAKLAGWVGFLGGLIALLTISILRSAGPTFIWHRYNAQLAVIVAFTIPVIWESYAYCPSGRAGMDSHFYQQMVLGFLQGNVVSFGIPAIVGACAVFATINFMQRKFSNAKNETLETTEPSGQKISPSVPEIPCLTALAPSQGSEVDQETIDTFSLNAKAEFNDIK